MFNPDTIPPDRPVLIAGATASGKSALALQIAEASGGVIINADALQVYGGWRILTARPPEADLASAAHALYGHVDPQMAYSVGDWMADLAPYLAGTERPIIVGGTGLYFRALTEGLADIPVPPPEVRAEGDRLRKAGQIDDMIAALDPETAGRIDTENPMRVQRAWEVLTHTGRGLAHWQDTTPAPRLPLDKCCALHLDAEKDWLNARIEQRFDLMLNEGVLGEAAAMMDSWSPDLPSARAIGAAELIAHLRGELTLDEARQAAVTATRQYAKRQRTWFRARMKNWHKITLP